MKVLFLEEEMSLYGTLKGRGSQCEAAAKGQS